MEVEPTHRLERVEASNGAADRHALSVADGLIPIDSISSYARPNASIPLLERDAAARWADAQQARLQQVQWGRRIHSMQDLLRHRRVDASLRFGKILAGHNRRPLPLLLLGIRRARFAL